MTPTPDVPVPAPAQPKEDVVSKPGTKVDKSQAPLVRKIIEKLGGDPSQAGKPVPTSTED